MIFLVALLVLTFITNLGLGVFILSKNPKRSTNGAYAIFALATAGWNLSVLLTITEVGGQPFWGRAAFSFGALMAASLLWFVHHFPEPTRRSKTVEMIAVAFGLVFFVLPLTPLLVTNIRMVDGHIAGDFTPLYLSWFAFFVLTLCYNLFVSWRRTKKTQGLVHNQLLAVTLGITAFWIPALVTQTILPLFFNDFRWNTLGPIFTIFLNAFIAHAIISYRFLEIRWVIKKSFDFVFLWAFAFLVIFGFQSLLVRSFTISTISVLSSFVLAILFVPFANYINVLTAKATSRGSYVFDDAVSSITELVHTSIGLEALQQVIADKLTEYFGFSKIAVAAFTSNHPEQPVKTLVRGFNKSILRAVTPGIRWCEQKNRTIVEASELRWKLSNNTDPENADCDRQILAYLDEWNAAVLIPLFVGTEMVGLILLGEKKDGSVLTQRDRQVLNILQGTSAPAMANGVRFAEIKRLYTQLASLDKAKSEFIGVVSHQFRTPLTAILWNSELTLEDKKLPKDDQLAVQEIHQRASFLNVTLNRIFDLLALENKQLTFENKLVNFRDVVKSVESEFGHVCKSKPVTITTSLQPAMIYGDAEKITNVVRTLIENACSFSRPNTEISVELSMDPKKKFVHLRVTDQGIGIPEEEMPHLFDKFYRSGAAKKTAPDGAGISLHLAKEFVERQHGKIDVISTEDKGTTFTVTFPMAEL